MQDQQWTAQSAVNYLMKLFINLLELVFLLPVFFLTWQFSAQGLMVDFDVARVRLHRTPLLAGMASYAGWRDLTTAHLLMSVMVVVIYFLLRNMFAAVLVTKDETDAFWNRLAERRFTLIAGPVLTAADMMLFFRAMLYRPADGLWEQASASGPPILSVLILCVMYGGLVLTAPYFVICFRHKKRSNHEQN